MKQIVETKSVRPTRLSILRFSHRVFAMLFSFFVGASTAFAQEKKLGGISEQIDALAGQLVGWIASIFFFPIYKSSEGAEIPLVVAWLVVGATYFTIRMGFINFRGFKHAIDVVRGKYENKDAEGEVSHFQALSSALSATVGLGNIAGVAIAVSLGGPGAIFWMIVAGFLGMSSKFTECTLGQKYRTTRADGRVMGGAMFYLQNGLAEVAERTGGVIFKPLGKFLAVAFAILCIGGSFGGGNTFQVNQSLNAVQESIPWLGDHRWVFGLIMTILTGLVIIGGIKRIAQTAEKIVPTMCGVYMLACIGAVLSVC
jgi:AGCS family alanine or glycine:cation symporter